MFGPDAKLCRDRPRELASAFMLAAEVWHWWIGIVLFLASLLVLIVLVVGYLKTVSSRKYPTAKQQRARHTDL